MKKIKLTSFIFLIFFNFFSINKQLQASCFKKIIFLIKKEKKLITSIDEFNQFFSISEKTYFELAKKSKKNQEIIFNFFSQIKKPFLKQLRKKNLDKTIKIIIENDASVQQILIKKLNSLNLKIKKENNNLSKDLFLSIHEKRAIHLMVYKKWWFQGLFPRNQANLSIFHSSFFKYFKLSYYIKEFFFNEMDQIKFFFDNIFSESSLTKKSFYHFSYLDDLSSLFNNTPYEKKFNFHVNKLKNETIEKKHSRFPIFSYYLTNQSEQIIIMTIKLYILISILNEYVKINKDEAISLSESDLKKIDDHIYKKNHDPLFFDNDSPKEKLIRFCNTYKNINKPECESFHQIDEK